MKSEKEIRQHKRIYRFLRPITSLTLNKYQFETDILDKLEGNYIVMSNHTTESDMLMLAKAFPEHMYYVCGEHLKRNKNADVIFKYFDPILEYKGTCAVSTVREILARIKAGQNIMIFPEGSRSFNGETQPVSVAAGKMVKLANCHLITYHIEGGYFIAPRWAYNFRVGPAKGRIVGIYTPEQLSQMTPQQITDIINSDIYEHAHESQKKNNFSYTGKGLAEGLENYLEICPECGAYDTMETDDNKFFCTCCNNSGIYTEKGLLKGDNLKFNNVYDWGKWMETRFEDDMNKKISSQPDNMPLFKDSEVELSEIKPDHQLDIRGKGDIIAYKDKVIISGETFEYKNIPVMSMLYYGKSLLFDYNGKHMVITGEKFHAWKYNSLHNLFLKKQKCKI